MRLIILSLACLPFMPLTGQAEELYRWTDSSGIVHYSDVPTAEAEKIGSKVSSEEVTPREYLPYETRRAQQNFPVTLYLDSGCGEPCNQARSLLNKRGIPFDEKILRTKDEIDAFKLLTGSEIVPTLAVGKTILKGFQSGQWQGELDIAGYPKDVPYRATAIQTDQPLAAKPADPEKPATP